MPLKMQADSAESGLGVGQLLWKSAACVAAAVAAAVGQLAATWPPARTARLIDALFWQPLPSSFLPESVQLTFKWGPSALNTTSFTAGHQLR